MEAQRHTWAYPPPSWNNMNFSNQDFINTWNSRVYWQDRIFEASILLWYRWCHKIFVSGFFFFFFSLSVEKKKKIVLCIGVMNENTNLEYVSYLLLFIVKIMKLWIIHRSVSTNKQLAICSDILGLEWDGETHERMQNLAPEVFWGYILCTGACFCNENYVSITVYTLPALVTSLVHIRPLGYWVS